MSGVFTLVEKVSSALGPFTVGIILESQGLIVRPGEIVVEQPEKVLTAIKLSYSLIPAAITLCCIPVLLFYRLDDKELEQARTSQGA